MAVVIARQPTNEMYPVYSEIEYGLVLTDLGTFPESKSIVYQVILTLDTVEIEITPQNVIKPISNSEQIRIDVSQDIIPYLYTMIPDFHGDGLPTVKDDRYFWGKVKIKTWEQTVNLDNCTPAVLTAGPTSNEVIVINSAPNDDEENTLSSNIPQVLDRRPLVYSVGRDSSDSMWIWGATSVVYTPNVGASVTRNTVANKANVISLRAYGPLRDQMKWMDVTLANVQGGITYRIYFNSCGKYDNLRSDVMFLSSFGGRCLMSFKKITKIDVSSTIEKYVNREYKAPVIGGQVHTKTNSYGRTSVNKKSYKNIEYIYDHDYDESFLEQFKNSNGYHVHALGQNTSQSWIKAELASMGDVYNSEMGDKTATLQILNPRKGHKYDL